MAFEQYVFSGYIVIHDVYLLIYLHIINVRTGQKSNIAIFLTKDLDNITIF